MADSVEVRVRAIPGAAREGIVGWHEGALKIKVCAAAEDGRANRAICLRLAQVCGVPRRSVTLIRGLSSRDKVVRIEGLTRSALEVALESCDSR